MNGEIDRERLEALGRVDHRNGHHDQRRMAAGLVGEAYGYGAAKDEHATGRALHVPRRTDGRRLTSQPRETLSVRVPVGCREKLIALAARSGRRMQDEVAALIDAAHDEMTGR